MCPTEFCAPWTRPVIDHRSAEFAELGKEVLEGMRAVFKTAGHVIMYPASGTGAWEAALVNTLSPGDRVVLFETGHFSFLWRGIAEKFGLQVDYVPGNWRRGASAADLEARLAADRGHAIKAVMVVHNETSTGVTSRILEIRRALDSAKHPALLLVDTISSLASIDYRHDEWGVDVTIAGSQKGLMLPPGMSFNAISEKALRASETRQAAARLLGLAGNAEAQSQRFFSVHAADQPALRPARSSAHDEGRRPGKYFQRHDRHAEATRAAVRAWGLEIVCEEPREYSSSLTAVFMPQGQDADKLRAVILEHFDMSLGAGLSKLAGKIFRIGHLGAFNDLMLAGTLCGVEMGLKLAGVPHKAGGVLAALNSLTESQKKSEPATMAR